MTPSRLGEHPSPRPPTRRPLPHLLAALGLVASCLAPGLAAQQTDDERALRDALAQALATIADLSARVSALEAERADALATDDLEALLGSLIVEEPPAPPRSIFPSINNPAIAVIMDAVARAGNSEQLGEDSDGFSLRETEVDMRSAVAPFADGVLVLSFEDAGNNEFESRIEEGYADITMSELLGVPTATRLKVGRFRAPFGQVNKLHTHDLQQTDRPLGLTQAFGDEGLVTAGLEATLLLYEDDGETGLGSGSATTAQLAVVDGEGLTGEEGVLGALAESAGLELDSDSPLFVGRLAHHVELSPQSDVEFGASYLRGLGSNVVRTDAGTKIKPTVYGLDATVRSRDDESGQDSWLFGAEMIHSDYDFEGSPAPGLFPEGSDRSTGYWVTGQRQMSMNTYLGLRVGQAEAIGTDGGDDFVDISPYVTWYANEFFRLRVQGQHIDYDSDTGRDASVNRVFLQGTWNFGAHAPHPYWTNR